MAIAPWDAKWIVTEDLKKGGGQGHVYLVSDRSNSSINGILKELRNQKKEQARARLRYEVAALQRLFAESANVPNVLDHNTDCDTEDSKRLYVVMDFIPGKSLEEYVDGKPLGIDESLEIVQSICKTMRIAHQIPILHRDLKPSNLIISDTSPQTVYVVDWGIAFVDEETNLTLADESFRNGFLDLPECNVQGGNLRDHRSDLTSLSGIFYYCLTGARPGQLTDHEDLPPHRRKGLSVRDLHNDRRVPSIESFFDRAFTPKLLNRIQSIDEIEERLSLLKDGDLPTNNPIELARIKSERMIAFDRPTQIAIFKGEAKALVPKFEAMFKRYAGKLGQFNLAAANSNRIVQAIRKLPDNLDFVLNALTVKLELSNHPRISWLSYIFSSIGDERVLLAASLVTEKQNHMPTADHPTSWKQVVSFGRDLSNVFSLVEKDFEDWLGAAIEFLSSQETNKTSSTKSGLGDGGGIF